VKLPDIAIMKPERRWPPVSHLRKLLERSIRQTAKFADLSWPADAELSCLFTNDSQMMEINHQWRSKEKSTNILSFPGADIKPGEPAEQMIGDLVLAFETVEQEAISQGKNFDEHLNHLLVHGFLHLFGHDHLEIEEAEKMEQLEIAILASMDIANPYEP